MIVLLFALLIVGNSRFVDIKIPLLELIYGLAKLKNEIHNTVTMARLCNGGERRKMPEKPTKCKIK